jgi:alkylation response protein AidB-like acyl-CoA dehydrogenase
MRPVGRTALPEVTAALGRTASRYDETGAFPHEGIQVAQEAGLLTATVGTAYGGTGLGLAAERLILDVTSRLDAAAALAAAFPSPGVRTLPAVGSALPWPAASPAGGSVAGKA